MGVKFLVSTVSGPCLQKLIQPNLADTPARLCQGLATSVYNHYVLPILSLRILVGLYISPPQPRAHAYINTTRAPIPLSRSHTTILRELRILAKSPSRAPALSFSCEVSNIFFSSDLLSFHL